MRRLKAQLMGMFSGKSQPPPPLIQLIYLTQPQIGWAAIPPLKSLRCEQAPDEKIGSNKLISIPNPNPVIRSKFSPELAEFTSAKVKCGGKRRARPLCFVKPGPHERFKFGVRQAAQDRAMSNSVGGHEPRFQLVITAIENNGPSDGWIRRAKVDVNRSFTAAVS